MSGTTTEISLNGAVVFYNLQTSIPAVVVKALFEKENLGAFTPKANSELIALREGINDDFVRGIPGRRIVSIRGETAYMIHQKLNTQDTDAEGTKFNSADHEKKFQVHWSSLSPGAPKTLSFRDGVTGERIHPGGNSSIQIEDPSFDEKMRKLVISMAVHASMVSADSMSSALVDVIRARMNGLSLRTGKGGGGVYWIPQESIGLWERLGAGMSMGGMNRLERLQTAIDPAGVETLMTALGAHVESEVSKLAKAMDEDCAKKTRQKTWDNRATQAENLRDKVRSYASILGTTVDKLEEKCIATENQVCAAKIATLSDFDW